MLLFLFVDYEKASDAFELNAALGNLVEDENDGDFVKTIEEANTGCSTDVRLFTNLFGLLIEKGFRHGEPLSP